MNNIELIKDFIERNIVFRNKPNYKNLQNSIGKILEEIKNNPDEYNKLLKIFVNDYGWNKDILDSLLNNDLEQFSKIKIKLDQNIIKEINEIETSIRKIIKNNDNIPNIEKLFPMIELKDKQLMEFKSLLNLYVINQFQKDINSGIYNEIPEEKLLEKLIEQVNNHIIKYKKLDENEYKKLSKKDKQLIKNEEIKINDKNKKEYHLLINTPRIEFNNGNIKLDTNTSSQIDSLMFFDNDKNGDKENKSKIVGEDVTADYTGRVDRHEEYRVEEDTLLRHEEYLNKISKIFDIKYEYYFDVNILFNINTFLKENNKYEYDNKLISNKEKYSSEPVIGFLKLIIKNYHVNNEGLSSLSMNEYRNKVKNNLFKGKNKGLKNQTYIDIKNNLIINNEDFMEGLKIFSLIKNKEELKQVIKHLYLKNDITTENQNNNKNETKYLPSSILSSNQILLKEINKDKLKNILGIMGQLILLFNNESSQLFNQKNEINENLLTNFYNSFIYITHSIYYLKFAKLELLNCLNNESISPEFSKFMEEKLYLNKVNSYQFGLDKTIKLQNSEKEAIQAKEEAIQAKEEAIQAKEEAIQAKERIKQAEEKIKIDVYKSKYKIIKKYNLTKTEEEIESLVKEEYIEENFSEEEFIEILNLVKEKRQNIILRREKENLIIDLYCKARLNPNNNKEEFIKKEFLDLSNEIKEFENSKLNERYKIIKSEGEFYLKISHLFELDINKRKKELKPELLGSLYFDKITKKIKELEEYSDFLTKKKKIEKEDKNKFIQFLIQEFKEIEKTYFKEEELFQLADKYIKFKLDKDNKLNQQNKINNQNNDIVLE